MLDGFRVVGLDGSAISICSVSYEAHVICLPEELLTPEWDLRRLS